MKRHVFSAIGNAWLNIVNLKMTNLKNVFFPSSFCTTDEAVIATLDAFRDSQTLTVFAYPF